MKLITIAALLVAAIPVTAAQIAYSNMTETAPGFESSPSLPLLDRMAAQTFQATASLYLTAVDIPLNHSQIAFGPTTDIISIFGDNSGEPGAVLATTTITGLFTFVQDSLRTALFDGTLLLEEGLTYHLGIQTQDFEAGRAVTVWYSSRVRNHPTWIDVDGTWVEQAPPPFERALRVWGETFSASTETPEPSTMVAGLALIGLVVARRTRNRRSNASALRRPAA